ncbi:heme o synthase [Fluviicola sp.]|jgi:protoheme IX farnesyltransferase|uniref:heme o synthase n=1 Tax=Fluviicola sp. TaxID=1917219 RepID=UPI002823986C|nr:heme o synthase [Fluviicola sp.]MDR0801415.1 heme o synthase [Fluviicola sp.]
MGIGKKVKMYMSFTKFRLSALVILSALSGYLFVGASNGVEITYLMLGGLLVTAASNGSNQIWERELDVLMNRTGKRPLPMGEMSVNEGLIVVAVCLLPGLWMLYQLNLGSMLLGLAAFVSYVFIYTPMKRISTWAVFIGAFPGAIPPMLGAVAGSDSFGLVPGVLFFVQFVWQFPHFWAIAWVAYDDYQQAGFSLLPSRQGRTRGSAFQIMVYSLALIPFSLLPWLMGWTDNWSLAIAGACSVLFFLQSYKLYLNLTIADAKKLMFASFIYLPVVQFLYVFTKIDSKIIEALWKHGTLF